MSTGSTPGSMPSSHLSDPQAALMRQKRKWAARAKPRTAEETVHKLCILSHADQSRDSEVGHEALGSRSQQVLPKVRGEERRHSGSPSMLGKAPKANVA